MCAIVGNLILFSAVGGGGYWLCSQARSNDEVARPELGKSGLESRRASVLDLSWSADGQAFLSHSVSSTHGGRMLQLHRLGADGAAPFVSTRPVSTGLSHIWNAILVPDALAVIVIDESNIVSRLDIESGARIELLNIDFADLRPALAISGDGSCLAIALDAEVRLYDSHSGRELLRLPGHESSVTEMIFSRDNQSIAAGYVNGAIRVWNRGTGSITQELERHAAPVGGIRFVNGGRRLASVGMVGDDKLRLSDLESGRPLWQVSADHSGAYALDVSIDGKKAVTGGHGGGIVVWDLEQRHRLSTLSGQAGTVQALKFSSDGQLIISGSSDGSICLFDAGSTELVWRIDVEESASQ